MSRLWRAYVNIKELKERGLRRIIRSRMRFVHHGWPLRPHVCACDVEFCRYLSERNIRGQSIFHFGTGSHHLVGLENDAHDRRNEILGLTLSPNEHASYIRRVIRRPALARHYKVLFADIYSLTPAVLPQFDFATLFHLAEFGDIESAARRMNDAQVLELFLGKLNAGGLLLFYSGSFGFKAISPLLAEAVKRGEMSLFEEYGSLAIYRAETPAN